MSELDAAFGRLRGGRRLHGISAVLLPYTDAGEIDWPGLERHVSRTQRAGFDVAINMDTGFGDLLSARERATVLASARATVGSGTACYAAAFADPAASDPVPGYHHAIGEITAADGIPVIIQCPAMRGRSPAELAELYARIVEPCEQALAFELSPVFAPHGEIWADETFARLLEIPTIVGAKHSSLDRATELRRLATRDATRPDFRVYTGNDLAIDMVAYGSDYLLGLSTLAPEAFAARDRAFAAGSVDFLAWNDALQHLGNVAFRAPVPAYKHSAALYLELTGGLDTSSVHPRAARREDTSADRALLEDCARRLAALAATSPSASRKSRK